MPRRVFDATVAAMAEVESDPVRATYGPAAGELEKVRAKAGRMVGCDAGDIILTTSATAAMFLIAQGLKLTSGDRILTTDHEHPGGRFGWEWAERRYNVHIDTVPVAPDERDPQAIVDRFAEAILPRTRILSFSHILYTTGVKLPVRELCALAREHGCWAVVDGAQAPGAMPVDVKALGCHSYAVSGHKWLCGPKGTGFLYVSEEMSGALDALPLVAGRSPGSNSTGIVNIPGLRGLGAAIDFIKDIKLERIEAHNLALRAELHEQLSRLNQVFIPAPAEGPLASANLSFCLPDGADLQAIRRSLVLKHNIYIRVVDQGGYAGLRASLHLFNSSDDIQALVRALRQELA